MPEEIFKEIMTENFPKLMEDIKSLRISENMKQGKDSSTHTQKKKNKNENINNKPHLEVSYTNC